MHFNSDFYCVSNEEYGPLVRKKNEKDLIAAYSLSFSDDCQETRAMTSRERVQRNRVTNNIITTADRTAASYR